MPKTSKTAKTIKITQTGSPIGRPADQERTLISLGLNKLWRSREVIDTPANRGRIRKVEHLLRVDTDGA
jgi:large subunit ribosomal protein L30